MHHQSLNLSVQANVRQTSQFINSWQSSPSRIQAKQARFQNSRYHLQQAPASSSNTAMPIYKPKKQAHTNWPSSFYYRPVWRDCKSFRPPRQSKKHLSIITLYFKQLHPVWYTLPTTVAAMHHHCSCYAQPL